MIALIHETGVVDPVAETRMSFETHAARQIHGVRRDVVDGGRLVVRWSAGLPGGANSRGRDGGNGARPIGRSGFAEATAASSTRGLESGGGTISSLSS